MEHVIEYGDYMPHGMCLWWQPWLVILWAGSNLLIFLSYTAIPLALINVLRRREDVPEARLVVLFAAFILLCGLTHFFAIVTLWYPIYPFVGWLKLATGLVSAATAIVLFRLVPALVAFPSPREVTAANEKLRAEIAAHQATLASLEKQVEARTGELRAANALLAVQAREAVHRNQNLLAVVSSLAVQTARGAERIEPFLDAFLGRIRALADATRSIGRRDEAAIDLATLVGESLEVLTATYGERLTHGGPPLAINPEAAQQISLALHELATNAQKYALGADDTVRIVVDWRVSDAGFELAWHEQRPDGGSPGAAPQAEGFGTKLLTRVVPAMLRGEASRSFTANGLVYRLVAPLDAVAADRDGGDAARMAARIVDESFGLDTPA